MSSSAEGPTDLEKYLFDVQGFILLRGAISPAELAAMNACIDEIPPMVPGEWYGYVHAHQFGGKNGVNLQQIYEAGEPFEKMIDHPAYFEKVRTFVGGEDTFDYSYGSMFIDENFVSLRGPSEGIFPHSGGYGCSKRTQYQIRNQKFLCGQVNVLTALTDVAEGDGQTVVVPGSHKANFPHPDVESARRLDNETNADAITGAIRVTMYAGDVLIFVDGICHGAEPRLNSGQRRICVYRYGASWGNFRHGYQVSPELLARLSPERRKIVRPLDPLPRDPQVPARSPAAASNGARA